MSSPENETVSNHPANDQDPGRSSRTWILFLLLPAVAIAASLFFNALRPAPDPATVNRAVGKTLSLTALQPLTEGSPPIDHDSLHGKVVLVNFWGTWCSYCRMEFPHLAALESKLRNEKEFQYVSISYPDKTFDFNELREDTQTYLTQQQATLPTYCDPEYKTDAALRMLLGDYGYPLTLILDRQGKIIAIWEGYQHGHDKEIEDLVQKTLANK